MKDHRLLFWCLVSQDTNAVCSLSVFAYIMAVITNSFTIFVDTIKFDTIKFLIIINVRFYSIVMKPSRIEFIVIKSSCSIIMKFSDIKLFMIAIIMIIAISITIKSCNIIIKNSDTKFLNIIIITTIISDIIIIIISIMNLLFADVAKFLINI